MKLSDIQDRLAQRPFRPFALETIGGSWVHVERDSDLFLSPRRPDIVVVFDPSGRLWILGVDEISSLQTT
jgi:hypothetical protein